MEISFVAYIQKNFCFLITGCSDISTPTNCELSSSQVEYILVKFDDENKTAQVSLRAEEVLAKLNEKELADPNGKKQSNQCQPLTNQSISSLNFRR